MLPGQSESSAKPQAKKVTYWQSVARIGIQVADGLQHAHDQGILHRDIKPSNLLLDTRGTVWITDFGLAKTEGAENLTATGDVVGTLRYMPPEAFEGKADPRSDIYSLGLTLYELLTLQPAFNEPDRHRLIKQVTSESPERLQKLEPTIPRDMVTIIHKAIDRDPSHRYQTAQELTDDLQRYLDDEPIKARRISPVARFSRWCKRNPVVASLTSAVALLLIVVTIGSLSLATNAQKLAANAQKEADERLKINQQINDAVVEFQRLNKEAEIADLDDSESWAAVLQAAERSKTLIEHELASPTLVTRVTEQLAALGKVDRDRRMVKRLDDIRLNQAATDTTANTFAIRQAIPEYKAAFDGYGIAVETLSIEQAAQRLRNCSPILRRSLIASMDHWYLLEKIYEKNSAESRQRCEWLIDVISETDSNPWRKQARDAIKKQDSDALRSLVNSVDISTQPAQTLATMAESLFHKAGHHQAAIAMLKRARIRYPNDFWINHALGYMYRETKPPQHEQSIRYYTVAVSIRPRSASPWINLGLVLQNNGELDEAIAAYRKAIELQPDYALAYHNLGNVLGTTGKVDDAIAANRKAIELKPDYASAYYNLGLKLVNKGNIDEAIVEYRKAVELEPKDAKAHDGLGYAILQKGNVDEAIAAFRMAIKLQPDFAFANHNLGVAFGEKGNIDEAIAAYRKAIELKSDYASTYSNLGIELVNKGNIDEAIVEFRKAVELEPKDAKAHNGLGYAILQKGNVDEAITAFRMAIKLQPNFALAHNNLGGAFHKQQKLDEAIAEFRKAIELDPKFAWPHGNLGHTLSDQGKLDEAIVEYRKAIEIDPKNAGTHNNLGAALEDQGKLDEAIVEYRKAIEIDPKCAGRYYNVGRAFNDQGKLDEAIVEFRKAIELQPDYAFAYANLGIALVKKGNVDEAIVEYRKAIELQPDHAFAYNNLGIALFKKGKFDEAIAAFRKALQLKPDYTTARNNLSNFYTNRSWQLAMSADYSQRDPEKAVELAKKAIELKPDSANNWSNLGVASYRAGDWQATVDALQKSHQMKKGGDFYHRFFLAMAFWQLDQKDKARQSYRTTAAWMDKNNNKSKQLKRFRAEAEMLLGLPTIARKPAIQKSENRSKKSVISEPRDKNQENEN